MSELIGIGTDITECLRIARMIERHGELFVNRVYTPEEIKYCQSRKLATQHFTGRWAAKEAILKVLGTGWGNGISWTDIEIRNEPSGQPRLAVRSGEDFGFSRSHISLSHIAELAVAVVILERD